jgi:hypothetical protein
MDGLEITTVMTSITTWNVTMMVVIVVDLMSILSFAHIVSALMKVAMVQLCLLLPQQLEMELFLEVMFINYLFFITQWVDIISKEAAFFSFILFFV